MEKKGEQMEKKNITDVKESRTYGRGRAINTQISHNRVLNEQKQGIEHECDDLIDRILYCKDSLSGDDDDDDYDNDDRM